MSADKNSTGDTHGSSVPTLVVDREAFGDDALEIAGSSYRHLFRARRLKLGSWVRVVDGLGRARWSEVVEINRQTARLRLGEEAAANEPESELVLAVATLRPERASWLVEKATEIGVTSVRWLHSTRSPRAYGAGTLERLRRVAVAAVEQCGRARVPDVTGSSDWAELVVAVGARPPAYVLDPRAPERWHAELPPPRWILIGPEGGWADDERAGFEAAGCRPLSLGVRTLRIETAAVVAAALARSSE